MPAVKRAIDRDRRPGRFLLSGSANLLLMRQVSESLAGRASYLTLWHLLVRLPAYAVNRTKRLVKSPRIFWGDTGVALHLRAKVPAGARREHYGRKARAGLLLHTGRTVEWPTPDVLAVPSLCRFVAVNVYSCRKPRAGLANPQRE
jgi:predicted AAA+ superfamily ATPase